MTQALDLRIPITIEVAPDGLHVTIAYDGTLASIPAAIERLRAAGLLDLVQASRGAHTAPLGNGRSPAQRVEPVYQPDGTACCPVHHKPLSEGRYGLFCPSRATGDQAANDKGYCNIRFAE